MSYAYNSGVVYDQADALYDAGPLTWNIEVDWNNDGALEGQEGARCVDLSIRRGRAHLLRANGKGFEPFAVGEAVAWLDNYDRRYDPYYSSGALYGNLLPGRDVRIRVTDDGGTHTLMRGRLADIRPIGKRAQLVIQDGLQWLKERAVRCTTQTDVTTDQAISAVLTAASYPSAWSTDLTTGDDRLGYFWASNDNALDLINDLAESEMGTFYVAADGKATFLPRSASYNPAAAVTFTQSVVLDEIALPRPWEVIRNIARVGVSPLKAAPSAQTLWSLNEPTWIDNGQTLTFYAQLRYSGYPAVLTGSPAAGITAIGNTQADGSGTIVPLTGAVTPYGSTLKLEETAGSGSCYITTLSVSTAEFVYAPDTAWMEHDASSGSAYGPRTLELDLRWQQTPNQADAFADYLASRFSAPLLFPTIQFENRSLYQFDYDLTAVVSFATAYHGLSAQTFRIGGIEHKWLKDNGQAVRTTWNLEPLDQTDYFTLDTDVLDGASVLAY